MTLELTGDDVLIHKDGYSVVTYLGEEYQVRCSHVRPHTLRAALTSQDSALPEMLTIVSESETFSAQFDDAVKYLHACADVMVRDNDNRLAHDLRQKIRSTEDISEMYPDILVLPDDEMTYRGEKVKIDYYQTGGFDKHHRRTIKGTKVNVYRDNGNDSDENDSEKRNLYWNIWGSLSLVCFIALPVLMLMTGERTGIDPFLFLMLTGSQLVLSAAMYPIYKLFNKKMNKKKEEESIANREILLSISKSFSEEEGINYFIRDEPIDFSAISQLLHVDHPVADMLLESMSDKNLLTPSYYDNDLMNLFDGAVKNNNAKQVDVLASDSKWVKENRDRMEELRGYIRDRQLEVQN